MKNKKENFWQDLKSQGQPILALAPMAGFTDIAFRQICSAYGADVVYSEMASATALFYHQGEDNNETLRLLSWDKDKENKYVVQLFGSNPEHFAIAARLVDEKIQAHGIDINFGCPVGKVLKQGAGADLMKNLKQSRLVIESVLSNSKAPVSVKIRSKSGDISALDFVRNISDLPVSAIMIHGRSLSQGFVGDIDFNLVAAIRPYFKGAILINGGVIDLKSAQKTLSLSGADGLGLARGALARPWLFQEIKGGREIIYNQADISNLLYRHALSLVSLKGETALLEWRKHACWYAQGLDGASQWRSRLVQVSTLSQLENILQDYGLNH